MKKTTINWSACLYGVILPMFTIGVMFTTGVVIRRLIQAPETQIEEIPQSQATQLVQEMPAESKPKTEIEPEPEPVEPEPTPEPQPQLPAVNISIRKPFEGSFPLNQGYHQGHRAVDWGTHYYTDILACDAGYVSYVGHSDLYGNHVYVTHSWGRSLYAHLTTWFYIAEGDQVDKGQALAQSGDSGDSYCHNVNSPIRCPHLHFGIQVEGHGWVDPIQYIN